MRFREKGGGYRQAAWDALQSQAWPTVKALADHIGCGDSGLRDYIAALEDRGYIDRSNDQILLKKATGPRAPTLSVQTGTFRDWNLNPPMPGSVLKAIIAESGLSLSKWLISNGFHAAGTTRLRQMVNGQRPVSDEIAEAAREFHAKSER
jgi:hypothetical protein